MDVFVGRYLMDVDEEPKFGVYTSIDIAKSWIEELVANEYNHSNLMADFEWIDQEDYSILVEKAENYAPVAMINKRYLWDTEFRNG